MNNKTLKMTDLLALLAFGLFAICVFLTLLTGAKVYKKLIDSGARSYEARTMRQYIATRVRQAETVSVEVFEGCSALVGEEEIDGEVYLTRVYCYDGYIRELYSAKNTEMSAEDGEKILPAESAEFSVQEGLLTARVGQEEITLHLRKREEMGS